MASSMQCIVCHGGVWVFTHAHFEFKVVQKCHYVHKKYEQKNWFSINQHGYKNEEFYIDFHSVKKVATKSCEKS
jgi:hypothetical protein